MLLNRPGGGFNAALKADEASPEQLLGFLAPGAVDEGDDADEERVWVLVDDVAISGVVRETLANDRKLIELQNGTTAEFNKNEYYRQNPRKLDKTPDMTNLTFLDEPNVFQNLLTRYQTETLMYTKSGMFTIAINPYKALPIYGKEFVRAFDSTPVSEHQPHVYPVSIEAYNNMMINGGQSQSILCTGESGAGKTVNCKHALRCLTLLSEKSSKNAASMDDNTKASAISKMSLEDQIMSANPILESFGNAKTVKNDNSSRFGRFTQIYYGNSGSIISSNIKTFLLEKSRVTSQAPGERNFHIFYMACEGLPQDMRNKCYIENIQYYSLLTNGPMAVRDVQSKQWTEELLNSFKMFNINAMDVFKVVSAVMLLPQLKFKMGGSSPMVENDEVMQKISSLLGIDQAQLTRSITEPTMNVSGNVNIRSQTPEQCYTSCLTIARVIYEQLFNFLVKSINKCTSMIENQNQYTINLVDIAGFEIFENNSLEQLQINLTNEKLQQFFNHHTFKLEKETYEAEGIDVKVEDYGLDLQPTIDMISNDPSAKSKSIIGTINNLTRLGENKTDNDLREALHADISGTSDKFATPKIKSDLVDFSIKHYAGEVSYNVNGWLIKNRHPIHDDIMTSMKSSNSTLMKEMFPNYSNVKAGLLQTSLISFTSELLKVMQKLENTVPHFLRCIIPNLQKTPGTMDYKLVVNQLRCNGIIEGIRIVRKGYPNRMPFSVFKANYMCILESNKDLKLTNARDVSIMIIEKANIQELSKVGKSKVFLKAEVIGMLEDIKSRIITHNIVILQALVYKRYLMMKQNDFSASLTSIKTIRDAVNAWYNLKDNPWFKLVAMVYPTMSKLAHEIELKKKTEALKDAERKLKENKETCAAYQEDIAKLRQEIAMLKEQNEQLENVNAALMENCQRLEEAMKEQEILAESKRECIEDLENELQLMRDKYNKINEDLNKVTEMYDENVNDKNDVEQEKKKLNGHVSTLNDQLEGAREENAALKAKIQSIETQFKDALSDLDKTRSSLNQAKKNGDSVLNDYEDLTQEAENAKKELAKLQKEHSALKRDLDQEKTENQNFSEQVDKLKSSNDRSNKKLIELEESLEQLNQEKFDLSNRLSEEQQERSNLEDDLEREKKLRSKLEQNIKQLNEDMENLSSTLTSGEEGMVAMKQVESQLKQSLAGAQKEREDLENEFEQTKKKLTNELNAVREQASNAQISSNNEIKKVNDECSRLNEEIEDLQSELTKSKGLNTETSTQNKRFESRIQELNTKVNEMENENANMKQNLDKKSSKLNEISNQLETTSAELNQMKNKVGSLSADNTSLSDQIGSLNDENRKAKKKFNELQDEFDNATATMAELEENVAKAQAQCSLLQNKLQSESERVKLGEGDAEELDNKLRKLQAEKDALSVELNATHGKVNALAKDKKNLQNELDDSQANISQLKKELDSVKRNAKGAENTINTLKTSEDELNQKLQSAEGEVLRKDAKLNGLNSEKQTLESNIASLNAKIKSLEVSLDDATADSDSAQKYAKTLKKLNAKEEEFDELQEFTSELEVKVSQLEGENNSLQQRLNNANTQHINEMETASDEYLSQMNTLKQQIHDAEQNSSKIAKRLRDASKKEKEANERAEAAETELDSIKSKFDQIGSSEKSLSNQLKERNAEVGRLKSENEDLSKQVVEINSKVNQFKRMSEDAEQKLLKSNAEVNNLRMEIDDAIANADTAQSKYKKVNTKKKELEAQLSTQQSEIEELEQQLESYKTTADKFKAEAQKHQSAASEAVSELEGFQMSSQSRISSLQAQVQELQSDVSRLRSQANKEKTRANEMDEELENLQSKNKSEVNKLNGKLRTLSKETEDLKKNISTLEDEKKSVSDAHLKLKSDYRKLSRLHSQLQATVNTMMAQQNDWKKDLSEDE